MKSLTESRDTLISAASRAFVPQPRRPRWFLPVKRRRPAIRNGACRSCEHTVTDDAAVSDLHSQTVIRVCPAPFSRVARRPTGWVRASRSGRGRPPVRRGRPGRARDRCRSTGRFALRPVSRVGPRPEEEVYRILLKVDGSAMVPGFGCLQPPAVVGRRRRNKVSTSVSAAELAETTNALCRPCVSA